MRQILFSKTYPAKHPQKGQETEFVFKVWNSLPQVKNFECMDYVQEYYDKVGWDVKEGLRLANLSPKSHTIRAGKRWKAGDVFAPKVWSGLPYRSKTIQFAPPIEVVKTWDFEFDFNGVAILDGFYLENENDLETIAKNDGLSLEDFLHWFDSGKENKSFSGQIICWNPNITY